MLQKKRPPPCHKYPISLFYVNFLKFSASNWQNNTNVKLWCPESVIFGIFWLQKQQKCKSIQQFVRKLLSHKKGIFLLSKWVYLVARGLKTHFSLRKFILDRFWKQKTDFLASQKGTKSLLVIFVKSVLPHHSFWKLLLEI